MSMHTNTSCKSRLSSLPMISWPLLSRSSAVKSRLPLTEEVSSVSYMNPIILTSVMVFLPTARAAGLFHDIFKALPISYPVWEIHSRMSQPKRTKATDAFRAAPTGVLFSSDVTARGIDVQGVTGVIQVGLPANGEQCESPATALS